MTAPSLARVAAAALTLCAIAACGKKGPPLAPLRPVPGPVAELTARRAGNDVRFSFRLPLRNIDNSTPPSLERVEVYAITVAADAEVPPNRDLLTEKYLVGTIPVRPATPEPEGAVAPDPKEDTRPAPGEVAIFAEELNEARMKPQVVASPVAAGRAPATTADVAAAWSAAAARLQELPVPSRIYVLRGVSLHGRPGQPSARLTVPLTELPAAPANLTARAGESSVTLTWSAPELAGPLSVLAPAATFNVYAADGTAPLNPAPLAATRFERPGLTIGVEECFLVRTALTKGDVTIESPPSAPACVTPADTFPPAAPKGLSAVATAGAVNLIWEANTESDLGGYIVLRGEAPGDKLQAITAAPIRDTTYRDATVTPGVRYVYAIVAVDMAKPPNTSPQSTRVEETAR